MSSEREQLAAALKRAAHARFADRAVVDVRPAGGGQAAVLVPPEPASVDATPAVAATASISFNASLLRAVRVGTKTQTRRPIRPTPASVIAGIPHLADGTPIEPLARAGGALWVRESWARVGDRFVYAADRPRPPGARWVSSRFMPREAARLFLRVKESSVARLSAIDDADARAEGAPTDYAAMFGPRVWFLSVWDAIYGTTEFAAANDPWVWVIRFEVDRDQAPR